MTTTSAPVSRASILAAFISQVKNPVMASGGSVWNSDNPPGAGTRNLGDPNQPNPTWPANVGEITTTNVFYILHGFAVALTRHRRARTWMRGNLDSSNNPTSQGGFDMGIQMTSMSVNNVVWFPYPAIPDVGTPVTAAVLTNFLNALRAEVINIKSSSTAHIPDLLACHSSCHSSCHGSRGRR